MNPSQNQNQSMLPDNQTLANPGQQVIPQPAVVVAEKPAPNAYPGTQQVPYPAVEQPSVVQAPLQQAFGQPPLPQTPLNSELASSPQQPIPQPGMPMSMGGAPVNLQQPEATILDKIKSFFNK